MKLSLNKQIFFATGLGVIIGLFLARQPAESHIVTRTLYVSQIFATLFIDLLKMVLIPLVFTSISVGIANLRAHAQMHRVWPAALIYYFSTTGLAVLLGLIVVNIFKPGQGLNIDLDASASSMSHIQSMTLPEFIQNFLANLFVNPVAAMADGQVLPTVLFALILGIALIVLGERSKHVQTLLNELFEVIMLMVQWIMRLAPLGIMCLLIKLVSTQDPVILKSLIKFITVVIGATLFHGFVVLPTILYVTTRTSPLKFYKAMSDALITAFSTSSSAATLPITIQCVEKKLGVNKDVAGFVLPLGATINMDGTALYEAVAALFIANLVGIDLNIVQQMIVFFTAIIAAIGAPGIPSAGMVTMVMVLQSVGLPAEAIAILLPIDRLLDAVRTMVNVEGDAVGSMVVQKVVSSRS